MNKELAKLRERISRLSDEELLMMVNVDAVDYLPDAIDYA